MTYPAEHISVAQIAVAIVSQIWLVGAAIGYPSGRGCFCLLMGIGSLFLLALMGGP